MSELLPERREPDPTLLEIGTALTANVGMLVDRIDALAKRGQRRQIQIWVLGISVLLDILLSVGLFISVHRTTENQSELRKAVNTARTQCEATNESSAKQITLWKGVLGLTPREDQPPPDPRQIAEFNKLLADTFVVQDCSAVHAK